MLSHVHGPGTHAILHLNARFTPIDLSGLVLNVLPSAAFHASTTGAGPLAGHAMVAAPIPTEPSVTWFPLVFQWLVVDPGASNAFGLSASRALEVRVAPRL